MILRYLDSCFKLMLEIYSWFWRFVLSKSLWDWLYVFKDDFGYFYMYIEFGCSKYVKKLIDWFMLFEGNKLLGIKI